MSGLKIALICNMKPAVKDPSLPLDHYSECDSLKTVGYITKAIEAAGHTVVAVEADATLPKWLSENKVDLAFNIAEGFHGEAREALVPALLETLGIPYTGSGVLALALALDKARSKMVFKACGIPTPNFQIFTREDEPLDPKLHYPLIVKPNYEGSGKGITANSVVRSETALRAQVRRILEEYKQEVLVEEFIDGTELTVGILGDDVLPILEIDFSSCAPSGESFYSWRVKEYQGNKEMHLDPKFHCPARLTAPVSAAVSAVAKKASLSLGCRDIARVDIRLSGDGIPYVLEVNTLPGLDPEESNIPMMIRAAGIAYEDLIGKIIELALVRRNTNSSIPSFKTNSPENSTPPFRALPGPKEKGTGQSSAPSASSDGRKLGKTTLKEEDRGR
jgi:D-alanine-D-alanine ligase